MQVRVRKSWYYQRELATVYNHSSSSSSTMASRITAGQPLVVCLVLWVVLTVCSDRAEAASEAQLKFVPIVAVPSRGSVAEKRSRSPRHSGPPFDALVRTAVNTTIIRASPPSSRHQSTGGSVSTRKRAGPIVNSGNLETAATFNYQQLQRRGGRNSGPQSGYYGGDEVSRNYRGNRAFTSADFGAGHGSSVHFGTPHGEHYFPSLSGNRHHSDQRRQSNVRRGAHHDVLPNSQLHHVPLRENRVEVRIDDFRRDQGALSHAGIGSQRHHQQQQQQRQHQQRRRQQQQHHHQQQLHPDRVDSWQTRPNGVRPNTFVPEENHQFDSSLTGASSDSGIGEVASCGPQSPCLEPNGLFPLDGNCCGFVSCANCRPYTQRCAAGTVFDLNLWTCNHERDVQQCAGNNRDCAHAEVNLRDEYGTDSTYDKQGGFGGSRPDYPHSGGHHPVHHHDGGPSSSSFHNWHHSSGDYGRGHHGQRSSSSWELTAASEVSQRSGKVPRVTTPKLNAKKKKASA